MCVVNSRQCWHFARVSRFQRSHRFISFQKFMSKINGNKLQLFFGRGDHWGELTWFIEIVSMAMSAISILYYICYIVDRLIYLHNIFHLKIKTEHFILFSFLNISK